MSAGTTMLGRVMNAFKAPGDQGLYDLGGGADITQQCQKLFGQQVQGEPQSSWLEDWKSVPMQSGVLSGLIAQGAGLFFRPSQLRFFGDSSKRRQTDAMIVPIENQLNPDASSLLTLCGAMKEAGAKLSRPLFGDPSYYAFFSGTIGAGIHRSKGWVEAVFEQDNVRLRCSVEVVYLRIGDADRGEGQVQVAELGREMLLTASLSTGPALGFSSEHLGIGDAILDNGLRSILSPFVNGGVPFAIAETGNLLFAGVRGLVQERCMREASQELGIGVDGTVKLPG